MFLFPLRRTKPRRAFRTSIFNGLIIDQPWLLVGIPCAHVTENRKFDYCNAFEYSMLVHFLRLTTTVCPGSLVHFNIAS